MGRPNLVFVFADQMRASATGHAGDPNAPTPHLDRLADTAISCTTAVSNCPVCTPYRACLLTGQYPLTHGLFMNDLHLKASDQSLGQVLRSGGYRTAWIGKWHLDGHGRSAYIPPERRQGFEYWKVLECTHDYLHSAYYAADDTAIRQWDGYDAYAQTADAVDYIRSRASRSQPFALFLSFGPPHNPYDTAPPDLLAQFEPERLELSPNVPDHRQARARRQLQGYYAHVAALDRCVARLDEALAEKGLSEDTILVFTSDHGDQLESHWHLDDGADGSRKQMPYDESVLVPFLLRYPARFGTGGRVVSAPLATPDIMPTLLSLCSLDIPDRVEGVDLTGTLDGSDPVQRTGVLIAAYHPFADWRTARGGRPFRGIRTERYTYVRDAGGPWMLFDNCLDPYQLENCVNQASVSSLQRSLGDELSQLLDAQEDRFEPPADLRDRFGYTVGSTESIPYSQ